MMREGGFLAGACPSRRHEVKVETVRRPSRSAPFNGSSSRVPAAFHCTPLALGSVPEMTCTWALVHVTPGAEDLSGSELRLWGGINQGWAPVPHCLGLGFAQSRPGA